MYINTYHVISNKGSRPVNEDSVGVFRNLNRTCFVVCDGLGGHGMGDMASSLVRDVFEDQFCRSNNPEEFLPEAFSAAQDILMTEQKEQNAKEKMKTTCVALVLDDQNAYIGHIGDSRLYVFHKNRVKMRTLDHSVPQMLVLTRQIKEKQIRNHPDRNLVLRVLGVNWEEPMYELEKTIPLTKCQAFLLCTDGFWELIGENEMCKLLKKASNVEEWLLKMTQIVKENGKDKNMDNYSAIAVFVKTEGEKQHAKLQRQ